MVGSTHKRHLPGVISFALAPIPFYGWRDTVQMAKGMTAMADKLSADSNAAFLAENAKKEGVTTTASGLQYRVIAAGSGKKPGPRQTVTVHYAGSLIDGTEFDSSYRRGQTISFCLDQVIPGWTEGLQLMQEGETAELVIPEHIGYGARGAGASIPPYQTLIFKVELRAVS